VADSSNPSNRRRSERVMLEVSVVVWAESPDGEQLKEETKTLVVNAHGGLLNLHMEVLPAQPVVIVNAKSGREQSARVVRVDQPPGGHSQVAFEFQEPCPDFWPIVFPPSDWRAPS
jgi:hypothetical protein